MNQDDLFITISKEQVIEIMFEIGSTIQEIMNNSMPIIDVLVNSPTTANATQVKMITSIMNNEIFKMFPSEEKSFEDLL